MKKTVAHHRKRYSKPFQIGFFILMIAIVIITVLSVFNITTQETTQSQAALKVDEGGSTVCQTEYNAAKTQQDKADQAKADSSQMTQQQATLQFTTEKQKEETLLYQRLHELKDCYVRNANLLGKVTITFKNETQDTIDVRPPYPAIHATLMPTPMMTLDPYEEKTVRIACGKFLTFLDFPSFPVVSSPYLFTAKKRINTYTEQTRLTNQTIMSITFSATGCKSSHPTISFTDESNS